MRHYLPKHLLKTIYYSIFNSHLIYAYEVREQNQNNLLINKLTKLQNRALRLINFQPSNNSTGPLYHVNKILKTGDFINYKNALFARNTVKNEKPPLFKEIFNMLHQNHTHNTRAATYNLLHIPQVQTSHFG